MADEKPPGLLEQGVQEFQRSESTLIRRVAEIVAIFIVIIAGLVAAGMAIVALYVVIALAERL